MEAFFQQVAYVGAIALLVLVCIGIVCIAFAERGPAVEDDQFTPEAPTIPPAAIVHLSFWDRQNCRALTAEEIEDGRQMWEAYKARMDAIRQIERGEAV